MKVNTHFDEYGKIFWCMNSLMSSPSLCLSGSREMQSTPLAVALMRRWFGLATQELLLLQDVEETWAHNLPGMQTRTTAETLIG